MNTHEKINELLVPFALGELPKQAEGEVKVHLAECPQCTSELKRLAALLECTDHISELSADEQTVESAKQAIFAAVQSQEKESTAGPNTGPAFIWKKIMSSKITKLAAAAVIIIAVMIGINQFGSSGVAWGDVVRNVERAKTVSFRLITSMTGMPDSEIIVYDSSEYGSRMDLYVDGKIQSRIYGPKNENVSVMVMPEAKMYSRMSFTDEQRMGMQEREKDPREFVKLFLSVEHTELGRKTLDGVEVEGLEVDSPKVGGGMFESAIGRLWVDVETKLPVLMEIEGTSAGGKVQTTMVMDEFLWDEEFEASEFEPNIPEDYELMAETKLPEHNEGEMIKGLRFFAEVSGGRYPSSLASMTASKEMQEAWHEKYGRAPTNEELNKFHSLNVTCKFYADLLKEDKEVEYHGDTVTAEDIDSELMRWKISDDEYRVIYGDLRVENVVDKEKLVNMAIKLSGKKVSADKRGKMLRLFSVSEKDVIKGLGVFLEFSGGKYPSNLDTKTTLTESNELWKAKYSEVSIDKTEDKNRKKEGEEKVYDMFFASAFYDKLVREKKDVAYYGDKVTVEDSDKVLMRWNTSDNEYRVIFGDLSRKTVTAEELAELERMSLE